MMTVFVSRLLLLLAVVLVAASAARAQYDSRVRTLAVVPGTIEAFAQQGNRLAWARSRGDLCEVWTRPLRRDVRTRLARDQSCGQLAFDGHRVLLRHDSLGTYNHTYFYRLFEPGVPARVVGVSHTYTGLADPAGPEHAFAAGPGVLVFFKHCQGGDGCGAARPAGVYRPDGRLLVRTPSVDGLAVSGTTLAVAKRRLRRFSCGCSSDPAWSPDGRTIAFSRAGVLALVAADGSGLRLLDPTPRREESPAWSPDGHRLAFASGGDDERAPILAALDLRDGSVRELGTGFHPTWAPDGASIAFVVQAGSGHELRVLDVVTGASRELGTYEDVSGLDWAPDGRRIAVSSRDGLYVVSLSRTSTRIFGEVGRVDWAPDGGRLITTLYDEGADELSIVVIEADGRNVRTLHSGNIEAGPSWSPDGSRFVFVSDRRDHGRRELFVARADGTGARPLLPVAEPFTVGVVSLHDLRSGARRAEIRLPRTLFQSVVLGPRLGVGVGHDGRLHLFEPRTAALLRTVKAGVNPRPAVAGRSVVFAVGRTIFAVDGRTGAKRVVARTTVSPVGLSAVGNRITWAEPGRRTSRIHTLTL
jgi:hypothetical protein